MVEEGADDALWNGPLPQKSSSSRWETDRSSGGRASWPSPRPCSSPACPMSGAIRARPSRICSTSSPTPMSRCSSPWASISTPPPTRRRPPRCSAPPSTTRCAGPSPGSRSWAPMSRPMPCRTWPRPASSAAPSSWSARTTARAPASSRSARIPSRSSPRSASSTRGRRSATWPRMVEEGFAMSEASNLPAVISLRIRAAHLRGSMVCKDNVRPRIGMLDRLARPSFDYGRISHPPSTYAQEAQKFERRLPAARRFVVERGLNELIPGEGEGRRHHPAGRAHPDGAAGARAARLGRRLWQEPRARCWC